MYCSRQPWLPQGQGRPSGEEDGVAEFAGVAVLAGVEFAVNEDSHADASWMFRKIIFFKSALRRRLRR